MSQANLETTTGGGAIMPDDTSGVELASILNNWRDALHSTHSGTTPPAYRKAGMLWLDTTNAALWFLRICRVAAVAPAVDQWAYLMFVDPSTGETGLCDSNGNAIPVGASGANRLIVTGADGRFPASAMPASFGTSLINGLKVASFPVNKGGTNGRSYYSMAFLMQDGSIRVTGRNYLGTLGMGDLDYYIDRATVLPLPASALGRTPTKVYTFDHNLFVLMDNGDVYGCGMNASGVLGIGAYTHQYVLRKVILPGACVDIAVGGHAAYDNAYNWAIFLLADGTAYGTGYNGYGQLGIGSTTQQHTPQLCVASGDWKSVYASGGAQGCAFAIKANGAVVAWGNNAEGQLGLGDLVNRTAPSLVPGIAGARKVVIAQYHSSGWYTSVAILTTAGAVWCAGNNANGQAGKLPATLPNPVKAFTQVAGLPSIADISLTDGYYTNVQAVSTTGELWNWGYNVSGQLGRGNTTSPALPAMVLLPNGKAAAKVYAGGNYGIGFSCVIDVDGNLWAAGRSDYACPPLMDSSGVNAPASTYQLVNVRKSASTTVVDVFLSGYPDTTNSVFQGRMWALLSDGTVMAAGHNAFFCLGVAGNPSYQLIPSTVLMG